MCSHSQERRKFRRVRAPVYCRPAGRLALLRYETKDICVNGIRVLSDERHEPGEHIDLELLLPSREFLSLTARVVWIFPGDKARWEIGLCFVNTIPEKMALLELILEDKETNKTQETVSP